MKAAKKLPVTEALYHAARKPELGKTVRFRRGFCGRCQRDADVAEAVHVLSKRFGSWDDITPDRQSKRRYLCLPCGWAYRNKVLQFHPTILRQGDTAVRHPKGTELRAALSGPIPPDVAIMLPVSGKKAVAPLAQWGELTTDGGPTLWDRRRAQAVKQLMWLKGIGVPEMRLTEPAPPAYVLNDSDPQQWDQVQRAWRDLKTVRADKSLFPMLVKLTREKM